jgi:O-antigen/teichoic acid export membrane protein
VRPYRKIILVVFFSTPQEGKVSWRSEIFPMQWRISISWISGYFSSYAMIPIIFYFMGPIIAGRFGMTMSILAGIGALCSTWIIPLAPQMGMLIAKRSFGDLNEMFYKNLKIIIILSSTLSILMWWIIWGLYEFKVPYSDRILDPLPTFWLLIASVLLSVSSLYSTYLRAHKKEPLLFVSLLGGCINISLIFLASKFLSIDYVAASYLFGVLVQTPLVIYVWVIKKREWHL